MNIVCAFKLFTDYIIEKTLLISPSVTQNFKAGGATTLLIFRISELLFCFAVAICDLVHDVKIIFHLS